jgi:hypothetical protein
VNLFAKYYSEYTTNKENSAIFYARGKIVFLPAKNGRKTIEVIKVRFKVIG